MSDRDCASCANHTNGGCSSWECEFKPKVSDLISRQSLIANLNKFAPEHYTALVNNLIMKEPSVQQWIPATEAEPQEDGKYLICDECGFIDTAFYVEDDFDLIGVTPNRIIAWIPLPTPYEGVEEG